MVSKIVRIIVCLLLFAEVASASDCSEFMRKLGFTTELGSTPDEVAAIRNCHKIFDEKISEMLNELPASEREQVRSRLVDIVSVLPDAEYKSKFRISSGIFVPLAKKIYLPESQAKSVKGLIVFIHEFRHYLDYMPSNRASLLLRIIFPTGSKTAWHEKKAFNVQYDFVTKMISEVGYENLLKLAGPNFGAEMSPDSLIIMRLGQACIVRDPKTGDVAFDHEKFLLTVKEFDKYRGLPMEQLKNEVLKVWSDGENAANSILSIWEVNASTREEYLRNSLKSYRGQIQQEYLFAAAVYAAYSGLILTSLSKLLIP